MQAAALASPRPALPALPVEPRLLRGGAAAFARLHERIDAARRSIDLRCFDWRDDETGAAVARTLLAAADRGVRVTVRKDLVGAAYEYFEGNKQSLLHKRLTLGARLQSWCLMTVYPQWGSLAQRPSPLAEALARHPHVRLERDRKRWDHSKVWVFDDEAVVLGGMGIGDDFQHHNIDFMVELDGAEHVRRYRDRVAGRAEHDARRAIEFLVHTVAVHGARGCPLREQRLALLASARERLTIEMAYLGDPACTAALIEAVRRGVQVTLLTARRANVIGDLNLATCDHLLRATGAPDHLRVALHPRMVHGKAIVADGAVADVGSANFTPLSHGGYDEVDVCVRQPAFARAVEDAVLHEVARAEPSGPRVPYRRIYFVVERAIANAQGRRGRR